MIYCVSGKGWYKVDGKVYEVENNDYFILPNKKSHAYGAHHFDPWSIYWVHFSGEIADFYFDLLMQGDLGPKKTLVNTSRKLIFEDIFQHMELMNEFNNIIYASSFLYAYLSSFQLSSIQHNIVNNDIVQKCISFMKKNKDKILSLDDLAKVANVSASYLSSEFKKATQYSPMQLFTSLKIQEACQVLAETENSIKSIAYSLGYKDQYHFSKIFKNVMGISPKHFRQSL